jgi:hypothetical protein
MNLHPITIALTVEVFVFIGILMMAAIFVNCSAVFGVSP